MRHPLDTRPLLIALAVVLGLGTTSCALTNTRASTRGMPLPPAVTFVAEPQWKYVASRDVYVIDDETFGYDLFRIGSDHYLYDGRDWYRATAYDGPYVSIRTRYVPSRIFDVSDTEYRWRLHPVGWRGGNL